MCEIYNPLLALGIMSLTSYQNTRRTSTPFSQQSNLSLNRIKHSQLPWPFSHIFIRCWDHSHSRASFADAGEGRGQEEDSLLICLTAAGLLLKRGCRAALFIFLNVFEEIDNFSTSAMQKINSKGHKKAEISVNNSVNFPCFEEVRLVARTNGNSNVFNRFSRGHERVADFFSVLLPFFLSFFFVSPLIWLSVHFVSSHEMCMCTCVCHCGREQTPEGEWWEVKQLFVSFPGQPYSDWKGNAWKDFIHLLNMPLMIQTVRKIRCSSHNLQAVPVMSRAFGVCCSLPVKPPERLVSASLTVCAL